MQLNADQLRALEVDGYLFLPSRFSAEEVRVLREHRDEIFKLDRQEIVREKRSGVPRTAFACQTYDEAYGRLARHPRLVEPVQQILGGDVYMHQFKINAKAAFEGEQWQWHQDYGTWINDDDMAEPRAMNISVFLDDVTACNGPLMIIPGSHKAGYLGADHDTTTTSYPLWTLDHATVRAMADHGGLIAPLGPAGSMLMFHCNIVHASTSNMSPWDRSIVYLSLNRTDNAIRRFSRPDYIAHRDFTPIQTLADDCLLELARTEAVAV